MTTPHGRKLAIMRIAQSRDLDGLRAVWDTLGKDYQNDLLVQQVKDDFKAVFTLERANRDGGT